MSPIYISNSIEKPLFLAGGVEHEEGDWDYLAIFPCISKYTCSTGSQTILPPLTGMRNSLYQEEREREDESCKMSISA